MTAAMRDPRHQPLVIGLQGLLYLCGSGNLPRAIIGGEWTNLGCGTGGEQELKCHFPGDFCPTARLCQSGYFCVMDITSWLFFLTVYCLMTLMAESMHSPFYHQNFCCLVAFVSHSQQLKEIFAFWEFQESINISLLILQPIRIYHCFVKTFHFEIRRKTFRYVKKQFCLIFSLPSCKYFAACSLWK